MRKREDCTVNVRDGCCWAESVANDSSISAAAKQSSPLFPLTYFPFPLSLLKMLPPVVLKMAAHAQIHKLMNGRNGNWRVYGRKIIFGERKEVMGNYVSVEKQKSLIIKRDIWILRCIKRLRTFWLRDCVIMLSAVNLQHTWSFFFKQKSLLFLENYPFPKLFRHPKWPKYPAAM